MIVIKSHEASIGIHYFWLTKIFRKWALPAIGKITHTQREV